jgi:type I restriction enzyme, S subunit
MNGWPIVSLVDATNLITCGVAKRPDYVDSGIPFLSAKNVKNGEVIWSDHRYITQEAHDELTKNNKPLIGDILYTRVGSFGEAAIVDSDKEFSVFVSLTLIKPKHEMLCNGYLKYYLNSNKVKQLAKASISGSGVGNLNVGTVRKFPIPLPPIPEQKRIVAILDQAFADIEQARALTEQNLKNARELFESYLQQVFSQRGEGWEILRLDEVAKIIDSLHKTPKYSENGFPMVRVTDVREGSLDLSNTKKVDKETYEEFSKRYKAKIGDIVFSRVGSYGRSSIVTTDEPFCLGQNTVFLAPTINGYYFYYFLNSPCSKIQIDRLVEGTTQPTVSLKSIKMVEVPVPSEKDQLDIVKKIDQIHKEITVVQAIYQAKLDSLDELKKSLLQKAFTGELTAKSAA